MIAAVHVGGPFADLAIAIAMCNTSAARARRLRVAIAVRLTKKGAPR